MSAGVNLAQRSVRSCHVEAMKDEAFVTAIKVGTVRTTSDVFLVRLRAALQKLDVRPGLIMDAMLEAFADIVVRSLDLGLYQSASIDDRALYLRWLAEKINARADAISPKPRMFDR